MGKTKENLQAAFAGESQANRKYLAFAIKAERDGFPQIAKVFRAAASAETVHAHNHLRAMDGVKSTLENIQEAIEGEHYEFSQMYPEFIEDAEEEEEKNALRTFRYANEVEKVHHELYNQALEAAEEGKDLPEEEMWFCTVCGYTHLGSDAPDKCPVCNAAKKAFERVE